MAANFNIRVLVAPLDWGLGHATRCIPLIHYLLRSGCKVVIATEGVQEILLKSEFPLVDFVHIEGYRITYSKKKSLLPLKILQQVPKVLYAIRNEKRWLNAYLANKKINLIISDNRYGLYHPSVPSIIIIHQPIIKAPFAFMERIIQKLHYRLLNRFTKCWVPDMEEKPGIAGSLSHPKRLPAVPVQYIGPLSRFEPAAVEKKYALLIILSGPEPQRSLLEQRIVEQLRQYKEKVLLVRGLPGNTGTLTVNENTEVRNHLDAKELETAFNSAGYIIGRSGYTTVMDISKLRKKAILIPTPGQTEQEYLAKHLQKQGWCMAANQDSFSLSSLLQQAENFPFNLPTINMERYKKVLDELLIKLRS